MNYNKIAETLDLAAHTAKATAQISHTQPLNLEQAYAVQSISMSRRYIRGERLVGLKLGFTSKAKMEQMGVHDMIWGRLTDQMQHKNGDSLVKSNYIHPRAEPEIAFRINQTITEQVSLTDAPNIVDGVALAIEIIDSRYENFKFSLEDVVADNCSSTAFVVGEWLAPSTNIIDISISLNVDGEAVQEGNSNAILGNPWESLVNAVRLALDNGEVLQKGSIVLAGAATPATFVQVGQKVEAKAEGLGSVVLNVV